MNIKVLQIYYILRGKELHNMRIRITESRKPDVSADKIRYGFDSYYNFN